MQNKKAEFELGWEFFFNLLFVIAIIILMVLWIHGQASGSLMKKQILAKEACILATEAKAGSTIMIEHENKISIEKDSSDIIVKDSSFDKGYLYPCYLKDNVQFSRKDNITIIEIR